MFFHIFAQLDGRVVHVDEVRRGKACRCSCLVCGERLIAKKGRRRRPYFAHYAHSACRGGSRESDLHRFAKRVLEEAKRVRCPPGHPLALGSRWIAEAATEGWITFERVDAEVRVAGVQPDLRCMTETGTLLIEVTCSHGIDEDKLAKLTSLGLPVLEIRLEGVRDRNLSADALREIIIEQLQCKAWVLCVEATHQDSLFVHRAKPQPTSTVQRVVLAMSSAAVVIAIGVGCM
jgi:competence protein CoiA